MDREPLVQTVVPRKLPSGWRVTLTGFNFDLVLGAQFGALPLVTPYVQTKRELVFILPGAATPGVYPVVLEGGFGALTLRGVTVVELVDLDNFSPDPLGEEEYTTHLLELLPKGPAWTRRRGTNLWKLLSACSMELARVHARAADLLDELTPSQTVGSLAEWETELGLPEKCILHPATDDKSRRLEIFRKANSLGGCSAAYFEGLAALLGYAVQVEEVYPLAHPFSAGRATAGDALFQGRWSFAWRVWVLEGGDSAIPALRIIFDRVKPSHTVVWITAPPTTFTMVGDTGESMAGDTTDRMVGA